MADEVTIDPFEAAFNDLTTPAEKPSTEPVLETPPSTEPAPSQEVEPVEGAAPAAEPAGTPETVTQEPPTKPDPLTELVELMKGQQKAPEPPPQQPQQQPEPQPEPEIYSADEKAFLDEYDKDWPDIARAEMLKRRAEYRQLVGYVFEEVGRYLQPRLEMLDAIASRTHYSELAQEVPDYEDVREKVVDWVKAQPAYLQAAYNKVIESGTVDEAKDLIERYRRDTGAVLTPQPQAQPVKRNTELPTATKQAAASLAPVSSKRSAIVQAQDPNDFEGAFENFAKSLGSR